MNALVLGATPSPSPTPVEMELWVVSPGLEGFLFGFFLLALACIPLFWSMSRHLRRVQHNARLRQREEEAAGIGGESPMGVGEPGAARGEPLSAAGRGGRGEADGGARPTGDGGAPESRADRDVEGTRPGS